jgi:hypothetical protein
MITPIVRVGSAPYTNPQTWTDISADVKAISISRGRQHALDRIEAGTAKIILDNTDGNYWPTGGIYSPNVLPCKALNIRATYGITTYDLYYGFVEAWQPSWLSDVGGLAPVVTVSCADLQKNLSRFEITSAGYAAELSGTRVHNVLDSLGWDTALANLDTGQTTILASGALVNANAMSHLFTVMESERGQLFIAGDGHVQFQDRHARLKSPYTVSQATFGEDGAELPYKSLEPYYDDEFIYNNIKIGRTGGVVQTANDATSQTAYGARSLSKTSLLMSTDAEALSQAQYLLAQYKDATLRARTLTIYPQSDEANLYPKVLNYDISTRITLRLNQASLDKDYHIEGITHDYNASKGLWITKWQLSDADNQQYWVLGTSGLGLTTKLAY